MRAVRKIILFTYSDFSKFEVLSLIFIYTVSIIMTIVVTSSIFNKTLYSMINFITSDIGSGVNLYDSTTDLISKINKTYLYLFNKEAAQLVIGLGIFSSLISSVIISRVADMWPSIAFTTKSSHWAVIFASSISSLLVSIPLLLMSLYPLVLPLMQGLAVNTGLYQSLYVLSAVILGVLATPTLIFIFKKTILGMSLNIAFISVVSMLTFELLLKIFVFLIYLFLIYFMLYLKTKYIGWIT